MPKTKGWTGKLSAFGKYLQKHEIGRETIAAAVEITPSYVSMLAHGKAQPGFGCALQIERWTTRTIKIEGEPAPFRCGDWGL